MVRGVVLAAGRSSRMGRPKAALTVGPGGPTFAAAVVETLRAAGLSGIVVVAGAHPEAVRGALAGVPDVDVLHHTGWARGQLSSLLAGLDAVEGDDLDAILVTLVDVPLVRAATVASLLDAWRRSRAPVVRPSIGDRHGHPVIFDRAVFAALRSAPLDVGAKAVIGAAGGRVLDVPTDDPGVLQDFDTPDEYAAIDRT